MEYRPGHHVVTPFTPHIHDKTHNSNHSQCLQEERDSFQQRYMDAGWVDAFRTRYPEHTGYTYWSYRFNLRARNKGWRLDYFLVSGRRVVKGGVGVRVLVCVHDDVHRWLCLML